ncbi:MAG TPA: hypothetical protein VNW71_16840 [Thermoanaerobaculia bacterium]|nr:hypothetical protein [Thermoanaerobaculia bacterium]
MSNTRLYMNKVNGWEKIDTAMTANDPEVGHLGFKLPTLREKSQRMHSLYAEHAALAATRQTITQDMQRLIEEGDQIFRMLREALKDHYGKRNEKLVEFGVEPLRTPDEKRRRNRRKKSETPADSPAVSPAPAPDSLK